MLWEPHYYLLTSIGLLKFPDANMEKRPDLVPLRNIVRASLIDDVFSKAENSHPKKILEITHFTTDNPEVEHSMALSSETVAQITEWEDMIKRLHQLWSRSHSLQGLAENNRQSSVMVHPPPIANRSNRSMLTIENGKKKADDCLGQKLPIY